MEPTTIAQRDLRNDSARILREVEAGASFVVTVRGRPVARLVPERAGHEPRVFVPLDEALPIIEKTRKHFPSLSEIRSMVDDEPRY